jgi:hypothetical protein
MSITTLAALIGSIVCAVWRMGTYAGSSIPAVGDIATLLDDQIAFIGIGTILVGAISYLRVQDERPKAVFAIILTALCAGLPIYELIQ